ncbi:MAG: hypothetical protein CME62_04920 [Halobacteriovoraceae bacterium]|nr:hypothetical protein [Halobacteriovoraceae bacterium]|tara:strand:+ start:1115 stop:2287 length:1173 start_codon:yes stop_codon:yes gene_type:complete
MPLLIFLLIISHSLYADVDFQKLSITESHHPAKNTFVFWINGDSNRFRPLRSNEKKQVRIDTLDAARIEDYAKQCQCNVIIYHDQRGKDKIFNNRKHFGSYVKVYSNSKNLKINRKRKLYTKEMTQTSDEISGLLSFARRSFPQSNLHLVFRGHSFAHSLIDGKNNDFDYSEKNSHFHLNELMNAIEMARVKLATITFAACSMSNISFALKLRDYTQYMIASQVDIYESGDTGFNFSFLKNINNSISIQEIAKLIQTSSLQNFETIKDKKAYLLETPMSLINLSLLRGVFSEEDELLSILEEFSQESFNYCKIEKNISNRFIIEQNISPERAEVMNKLFSIKSMNQDYDLICLLEENHFDLEAAYLKTLVEVHSSSVMSVKHGISVDLTF